ncbi:fungal-specific transcription factor domain-containing protein [Myxozyma melibiosi]|uniref:Fungal-specific transcription factor domain-containing protein n=1 Tax=Myxozyma melibiosi TaxID=54550 RepID=A0ABR1F7Y6_9ASCO
MPATGPSHPDHDPIRPARDLKLDPDDSAHDSDAPSKTHEHARPRHSAHSSSSQSSADRRKLVIACIACRKKKVKCSGDRPACANCLRGDLPCQYPAVKNRGSRFGYHEMLNKRLEMMERHIKPPAVGNPSSPYHVSNKLSTMPIARPAPPPLQPSTSFPNNSSGSNDNPAGSGSSRLKRHADGSFKNGLSYGYNGTPSSEDVDNGYTGTAGNVTAESDTSSSRDRPLASNLSNVRMPDSEIIEHLTELYFRYLNNQSYAFLHKPSFVPRLHSGQVNPLLVLAVCAVSARFSRHPEIMTQPRYAAGEPFLLEARKLLSQEFDEPTIETTQALLIMGFSDFCGLNGGRAAIYSGLSMRMAATLGLNKEFDDPELSWVDREIRRKTWWSVLVFDRLAHSGPKRSFLLMEEECQISLPSSDHAFLNNIPVVTEMLSGEYPPNDPDLPRVPLELPGYHIKSVIMWGHIASYVNMGRKKENFPPWTEYSEFHKLEREIDRFYSSLPPHLVYSRDNLIALDATQQAGTFVHMHVAIQQCLCALHRCVYPYDHLNSKFEAPPISFIERSANKLTAAACSISGILNDTLQVEDVLPAAFVGFGAYNSATVHIVNAFSADPAISQMAKKHLTVNLKFLVLMREYWSIAGSWCTTLKERYFHKLQLEKNPNVSEQGNIISRPPSPTVRYGTLDFNGKESNSPGAAKSDGANSSGDGSNGRRTLSTSAATNNNAVAAALAQHQHQQLQQQQEVDERRKSEAQRRQEQQQPQLVVPTPTLATAAQSSPSNSMLPPLPPGTSYSDTLVLPSTFPPVDDEVPNPYLYDFDETWLRALENNKDQVVIDADRVGENSFLDFGSSTWFTDPSVPGFTASSSSSTAAQQFNNSDTQQPDVLSQQVQQLIYQQQQAQQEQQAQQLADGSTSANGDSFFNEIFGDMTWDLGSTVNAGAARATDAKTAVKK